jgi:hypothetical protein
MPGRNRVISNILVITSAFKNAKRLSIVLGIIQVFVAIGALLQVMP